MAVALAYRRLVARPAGSAFLQTFVAFLLGNVGSASKMAEPESAGAFVAFLHTGVDLAPKEADPAVECSHLAGPADSASLQIESEASVAFLRRGVELVSAAADFADASFRLAVYLVAGSAFLDLTLETFLARLQKRPACHQAKAYRRQDEVKAYRSSAARAWLGYSA